MWYKYLNLYDSKSGTQLEWFKMASFKIYYHHNQIFSKRHYENSFFNWCCYVSRFGQENYI